MAIVTSATLYVSAQSRERVGFAVGNDNAAGELGHRDRLHGATYGHRHGSNECNDGCAAGPTERHDRLAHRNEGRDGPNAPTLAMRACVGEVSARWGRDPRDIRVIKTRQAGSDDFLVEVAAGHKHGHCEVNAMGTNYQFRHGRI
jgi:hypothetical protein